MRTLVAFAAFTNVQQVFMTSCVGCHTQGIPLDLRPSVSYSNLVGVAPPSYDNPLTDESCGGLLVEAGDPDASYLYQKVSASLPCAGSQMPLDDLERSVPLVPCEQALIHDWIADGAANN